MIRVGGQSGTAIRSTMSSSKAGCGLDHIAVRPITAPARTLALVRFMSPIHVLRWLSLYLRCLAAELLADGDTCLPQEEVCVGQRHLHIDLAADLVGQSQL